MIEVTFWTFIHHELVIVFQIQVDLLMSVYKLDSRLSPICDLKQDFMSTLPLKDLQLYADDIDSVSKILMMLYIAGYKSRCIACRVSSSISGLSSTRAHIKTSSTKSWKMSTCLYLQESGGLLYLKNIVKFMLRHVPIFLWADIFYVVTRKYTN